MIIKKFTDYVKESSDEPVVNTFEPMFKPEKKKEKKSKTTTKSGMKPAEKKSKTF